LAIIPDEDIKYLTGRFATELKGEVQLNLFTRSSYHTPEAAVEVRHAEDETNEVFTGEANRLTAQILKELAATAPHSISVVTHDLDTLQGQQTAQAVGLNGEMLPVIVYQSETLKGQSRYFGLPSGYEFGSLVENVVDLSGGQRDLKQVTLDQLKAVKEPVQVMVFVTPTCGYCPAAVRLANQFAMANENITADIVEANEFTVVANSYEVYGVPKIVIRGGDKMAEFEGTQPEHIFLQNILKVV